MPANKVSAITAKWWIVELGNQWITSIRSLLYHFENLKFTLRLNLVPGWIHASASHSVTPNSLPFTPPAPRTTHRLKPFPPNAKAIPTPPNTWKIHCYRCGLICIKSGRLWKQSPFFWTYPENKTAFNLFSYQCCRNSCPFLNPYMFSN